MQSALLLFAILLPQIASTRDAIALRDLLTKSHENGTYSLTQSYNGKFTRQYDEDSDIRMPFADAGHKITHVTYRATTEGEKGTQRIYVHGKLTDKTGKVLSTSFTVRKSIPDFATLKSMETINEFETELGSMGDAIGAWIENDVIHSSKNWSGCTVDSTGNLRCIDVFLHTVNRGDGWEIELKHIYEGAFPPVKLREVPRDNALRKRPIGTP